MDKTAEQILSDFHGQIVVIKKADNEPWVGIIMATAGLHKADTLVPKTLFLSVDVISDIEGYKKNRGKVKLKHEVIDPEELEYVYPYDLFGLPVPITYSNLQHLNSGINPTSKWEITEGIKKGKVYIITSDQAEHRLFLDGEDNFILKLIEKDYT